MNLLPIDVIKLIADVYYTPIISSFESNKDFFITFQYPSNTVTLEIPRPNFTLGKGKGKICVIEIHETDDIDLFIKCLNQNNSGKLFVFYPFDLEIALDKNNIQFISENATLYIKNTESCRSQLVSAMIAFKDYLGTYNGGYM
jgi:hypothetical protein